MQDMDCDRTLLFPPLFPDNQSKKVNPSPTTNKNSTFSPYSTKRLRRQKIFGAVCLSS